MAANFDLSGASSIDASCFNQTTDAAYDDLRELRKIVTKKVKGVVKAYNNLKNINVDQEIDEDDLEAADESASIDDYNTMRLEAYDMVREWHRKTGETIRERPGTRPEMKEKAVMSYLKKVKRGLRKTLPLGGEVDDDEMKCWLEDEGDWFQRK